MKTNASNKTNSSNAVSIGKIVAAKKKLELQRKEKLKETTLTRGNKKLIDEAIKALPEKDRTNLYKISGKVSEILDEKFSYIGADGEVMMDRYQLKRCGMETSSDIQAKVERYFLSFAVPVNGYKEVSNLR